LIKLVIDEDDSKEARSIVDNSLETGDTLCTVDIALAEGLNALWKRSCLTEDLKPDEARMAADDLSRLFLELSILQTYDLREVAMEIALTQNVAFYDSLYVAAAKTLGGTLYTADQKLHTVACKIANSTLLKPT